MADRLATLIGICRAHGAPDELARNLAQASPLDITYATVFEMVCTRVRNFGLRVDDEASLVRALWRASK